MDRDCAVGQVCFCGRQFTQPGALKNHQKTCKKSKTRLLNALAKVKEYIASRKRTAEKPEDCENLESGDVLADVGVEVNVLCWACHQCAHVGVV